MVIALHSIYDHLFSYIASAIDWVIKTKKEYNTKVLNLSIGTPANNPIASDPLVRAVDQAVKAGITVVVAAGNSGPNSQTILSPGNSRSAITVGAADDRLAKSETSYSIAPFSSRGPTKEGLRKPDVLAPGVNIKSLDNTDGFQTLSGTSMATPVVSGCLALLLSQNSNLSPRELKSEIIRSCTYLNESPDNQGAGIINMNKLFKSSESEEVAQPKNPSYYRHKRAKPVRKKPISEFLPSNSNLAYDSVLEKQSYMPDGLVFLLFLILILIRII